MSKNDCRQNFLLLVGSSVKRSMRPAMVRSCPQAVVSRPADMIRPADASDRHVRSARVFFFFFSDAFEWATL